MKKGRRPLGSYRFIKRSRIGCTSIRKRMPTRRLQQPKIFFMDNRSGLFVLGLYTKEGNILGQQKIIRRKE